MTNQEVWDQYKDYSQTTSDIARKIVFAGIAVCWLFREPNNNFPELVISSLILLITFFFFDLMQYLLSTLLLKGWIRNEENKKWESTRKIEGDYQKPTWIDTPAFILFILKLICLVIAYIFLGYWLFN